jgi:acetyl-CoA synthetase
MPFRRLRCIDRISDQAVAVINKPGKLVGEIAKAFVVLKQGHMSSPGLADEINMCVKARLAADAYLPEIEFVTTLARTADGKLYRVALRQTDSVGR